MPKTRANVGRLSRQNARIDKRSSDAEAVQKCNVHFTNFVPPKGAKNRFVANSKWPQRQTTDVLGKSAKGARKQPSILGTDDMKETSTKKNRRRLRVAFYGDSFGVLFRRKKAGGSV